MTKLVPIIMLAGLLATGAAATSTPGSKAVPAAANIFGAGLAAAPEPGGGGGGVTPTVWQLPRGASRVVTFPRITGRVTPIVGDAPYNGPGGDHAGVTDVMSYKGISGIVHTENGMFLVGVFLTGIRPPRPAPARLDFSDGKEVFSQLEPKIGQTFLIGDGKGRSFRVPSAATRLFVGFADAFLYRGAPGWYGNNAGQLRVTVAVGT